MTIINKSISINKFIITTVLGTTAQGTTATTALTTSPTGMYLYVITYATSFMS